MLRKSLSLAMTAGFILFNGSLLGAEKPRAEGEAEAKADATPAFEVADLPKEEPIEGQLGEPGAPSLKEQQENLARSLLGRGICNASYFGEEFCKKQEAKTFRVTDQYSTGSSEAKTTSQE